MWKTNPQTKLSSRGESGMPAKTPMTYIKGVYFWIMFPLVTLFWFGAVLLTKLYEAVVQAPGDGKAFHRIASLWSQSILTLMPGWRVEVSGRENLPPADKPFVIVANHESMSDIWALYYLGLQFRWLAKESVFRYPIIGQSMRWAGYVPIKRGDKNSHIAALDQSATILRSGISMFFFPEGTRSTDGKIKAFKIGAFKMARECQVDILPVALHGAGQLVPKGSKLPGSSTIKVKVLPPMKLEQTDLEQEAARIREVIVAAHQELSGGKSS